MAEPIGFQVRLPDSYDAAIEKVTHALKNEGFGVLTSIDVKETLKEKLDVDFRRYIILGACNPPLAYKALQSQPLIGLLLPCNVTIEEQEGGTLVSIANPDAMLTIDPLSASDAVCTVAAEARARLERVAQALQG
ncbi:MAG TPA: DUF302 domain-containing protein [Anaerolineales bacterium]|jgi:uncharacterized protein (DUF302 family)|nr:DUF302 domain-containing protein [Anaerolineales bacterium]